MDEQFWRKKTVFLTGHTGFKGSWLTLWLRRLGAEVAGYALAPPTNPNLFELAGVADDIISHIADIRDGAALTAAMQAARPDVVFHLAAQPLVLESYRNPVETFETNVTGTVNVLEAIRRTDCVRGAVIVTTDKCYANQEWDWGYREIDALGGKDPYSASKAAAELVSASYRASYFGEGSSTRVATARAGNVIGGGDFARDRLLTDIVAAIRKGEPVQIRNPGAVRPWQHVLEPLSGYLLLAEALCADGDGFAEAWNFGPEESDARSVGWICDRLVELWGNGASWVSDHAQYPKEATLLKLDCSRARSRLGWRPRLSLGDALDWIVDWYRAEEGHADMRHVTLSQIDRYRALS